MIPTPKVAWTVPSEAKMKVQDQVKAELKEIIRSSNLNPSFPEEIMHHPGGEKLARCYQCGVCAGSCPVGKLTDSYRPRQIIRMTLLGMKNEILSGDSIWLCASCYTCQERCPQGVEIADLMLALRNMAVENGYILKGYVEQVTNLLETGRIPKISGFTKKKRPQLDLPPLPNASVEAMKKIAEKTGFDKLVDKLKG